MVVTVEAIDNVFDVLGCVKPSFFHTYVNGPVPEATVEKLAGVPGHSVRLVSAVALVSVFTVKVALFVTLVQVPLTVTV